MTSPSNPTAQPQAQIRVQLNSDQLAKSQERQAKKARVAMERRQPIPKPSVSELLARNPGKILDRKWVDLCDWNENKENPRQKVKILSWNLLAQTLVRREVFPTSGNSLKAQQRELMQMLHREILTRDADILCFQEVDRLESLTPLLENAGYAYHYACGPGKKHGCLIAWKSDRFTMAANKTIFYDDEYVRGDEDTDEDLDPEKARWRRGSSFKTKNIANLVGLSEIAIQSGDEKGFVVGTTHLFWHPKYTYERTRQTAILDRAIRDFRSSLPSAAAWPIILGGDFNFPPSDPAYALLFSPSIASLSRSHIEQLSSSRVVHASLDPTVDIEQPKKEAENDEAADPDRVITRARSALPSDGLLSDTELVELFSRNSGERLWKSAYEEGLHTLLISFPPDDEVSVFGDRVDMRIDGDIPAQGYYEPEWTSYTHFWKSVLDYIFILDPPLSKSRITALLLPLRTEELEPGLPQPNVCGSDHISLCAEVSWW